MNTISRTDLQSGITAKTITVVDALPEPAYRRRHLPTALNLTFEAAQDSAHDVLPDRSAPIVVYSTDTACTRGPDLVTELQRLGYEDVRLYSAGIEGWVASGLPVDTQSTSEVLTVVRHWAAAEGHNDAGLLDDVLAEHFVGIGPVGFVLPRDMWLGRYARGLENRSFELEDLRVHDYGTTAVVVGVLHQDTLVKGTEKSGRFRVSLTAVQQHDRWLIASVHIGALANPAASADAPGRQGSDDL